MSRSFILGRLYKWWGRWDVTNLIGRHVAPTGHTLIFTCEVYTSRLTRSIRPMFGCTYWSHGDPYVWGLTTSKVLKAYFILAFHDFPRQWRSR